jgi:hypothetical protein
MNISFFSIFRIFGVVSAWAEKALEDGKITVAEASDLAEGLGKILGIPTEIQVIPDIDRPILTNAATEDVPGQPIDEEPAKKPPSEDQIEAQADSRPHKTEA